jgi:putative spermidine/putrescine transport system substrate-binding protein/spermidine/putrescine transport system substrate-binding protein
MRSTVRVAIALGLALLVVSTGHAAKGRLNVLTWEGYADPSFVKPFTEKTGCQVQAT